MKEEKLKGFLIDVYKDNKSKVTVIDNELESIYKALDVKLIEVHTQKIGDLEYDIICDEEGLWKDMACPSIVNKDDEPLIVGNILICRSDEEGNFCSINDFDIANIRQHIIKGYAVSPDLQKKEIEVLVLD